MISMQAFDIAKLYPQLIISLAASKDCGIFVEAGESLAAFKNCGIFIHLFLWGYE
jgi:hypothetical protein